jgi:hypothetical protein
LENNIEIWCVGGKVHNEYTNKISEVISNAMSKKFAMGLDNFRTIENSKFVDTIGTPMYPKFIFEKI